MNFNIRVNSLNIIVWVVLLTMPLWLNAVGSYTQLGTMILVMGLAAMALNFLLGHTGVLSFGHAAYFGLGAYGTAMAIRYLHTGTLLAILVGIIAGAIAAALIGPLIVKRRGVYFAMVTIAFAQVFYFIAFRWHQVTGGDDGLTNWHRMNIGPLVIYQESTNFYYFVLAVFALAVIVMAAILKSPFGRTLIAIRENERRSRFLGISVNFHIWLSWVISCTFMALAGSLFALQNNFIDPHSLYWTQSGIFVIMCVLGGMRSFWGPLVGAAIYVVLQDKLSSIFTDYWQFYIGLVFVLVVLFFPRGVLGMMRRRTVQ